MLIDASHSEETRVTIVSGNKLEEFDFETASKKQLKGNVYLARITRVEPSLQAAFVEYGGNRHGFLAFNEIHPDYYQIPAEDREVEEVEEDEEAEDDEVGASEENGEEADVETMGDDSEDDVEQAKKRRPKLKRQYKIQEVIKKRQVMLIQVAKEERGNKGAAITTYLSLAGRYCVLMPNTARGGGVSRKITNQADRKRLKKVLSEMEKPAGMGVIVRTAGAGRTKVEVKRDYEYTFRLWDKIREQTLKSIAPALIHEEASLIHRAIRDMYNKEIDEVIVAGEKGYKEAKAFMKELTPSHAKKVQMYKDETGIPLFQRYQVEGQLSHIYDTTAPLRSGGSIVMNQTEALVAIDVNSGRATKERHIDDTALNTNLEAAEEVARQLRLRDMAGLIVIDFIDMDCNKANAQVERKLKEALRKDRARIQVGRISQFGLLEMSRQRLRPSLIEATSSICSACAGSGSVPSTEVAAMMVVRAIEEEAMRRRSESISVMVPASVGFYLLNNKRKALTAIELNFEVNVSISVSENLVAPAYELTRDTESEEQTKVQPQSQKHDNNRGDNDCKRSRNNRNRRNNNKDRNIKGKNHSNDKINQSENGENANDISNTNNANALDSRGDDVKPNKRRRNRNNRNRKPKFDADGNRVVKQNPNQNHDKGENSVEKTTPNNGDQNMKSSVDIERVEKRDNKPQGNNGRTKKPVKEIQNDIAVKNVDAPVANKSANTVQDISQSETALVKKATAKKATAKKATAKKATAKKATAKKATAKKATAKKATAKKATAKKATAKKATAKKATAKKAVVKKVEPKVEAKAEVKPKKTGWWSL